VGVNRVQLHLKETEVSY